MKRRTALPLVLLAPLGLGIGTVPFLPVSAQDATDLAAKLAAGIEDGSSLTRLRMIINSGDDKTVLNMQIKSRHLDSQSEVLYQVIFPADRKGESALLSQEGTSTPRGFTFKPPADTAESLDKSDLTDSVFGSDLSYQDIIENETLGRADCVILESRPGPGDSSPYGVVKSWVDPDKMVTMKVQKYDGSGNLVREIETLRVSKDDRGRNIPAKLMVRRPGMGSETELDGSNIRHDVEYTDEDFTPRMMATLR